MQILRGKLKSKAGASFIVALLLFLFCAFAGGTMLIGADAALRARPTSAEGEQAWLALASAAEFVRDELLAREAAGGLACAYTEKYTAYPCVSAEYESGYLSRDCAHTHESVFTAFAQSENPSANLLSAALSRAASAVAAAHTRMNGGVFSDLPVAPPAGAHPDYTEIFTLEIAENSAFSGDNTVTATLIIRTCGNAGGGSIVFSSPACDRTLTLNIAGEVTDTAAVATAPACAVHFGRGDPAEEVTEYFAPRTTAHTVRVRWTCESEGLTVCG